MTHTPGPWFLDRDGTLNTNVMAPDDEHSEPWHVAVVVGACGYPDRPETGCAEANAHLIAAAPDLLACAKIGAECFREYERLHRAKGTPEGDAKAERNAAMARVCEAAIAQAEAQK